MIIVPALLLTLLNLSSSSRGFFILNKLNFLHSSFQSSKIGASFFICKPFICLCGSFCDSIMILFFKYFSVFLKILNISPFSSNIGTFSHRIRYGTIFLFFKIWFFFSKYFSFSCNSFFLTCYDFILEILS